MTERTHNVHEDAYFMRMALYEAAKAAKRDEVPVGCVIVRRGRVIARGRNKRERGKNPLMHAELSAISRAARFLGGWRLTGCTLYVTLEPCPMCAGAIINARIPRVVYGAADPKAGCFGSVCDLNEMPFNHKVQLTGGVLGDECAAQLSAFFRNKRKKTNA